MPTQQETFDTVARHLLTQAKKSEKPSEFETSETSEPSCLYRGPDGASCAAGCLIPDSEYSPNMEGFAVVNAFGHRTRVGELLERLGHDSKLAQWLQRVHDGRRLKEWPEALRDIAHDFDLSAAVVDELEASFVEKISA